MHDFKRFPELTNGQMQFYYFASPHRQIQEGFTAKVIKVTDGDSIKVRAPHLRDFDFPIRFANINAREMSEGGEESKRWLDNLINDKDVYIKINPRNRVGKFGRLIGEVFLDGININYESLREGHSVPFGQEFLW
jgi:endonuclease YncB( thermonuclease family)